MKQKLIDANKLRKDFLCLPNCPNGFSDTYDKSMILTVIDEQPTAEAVPVEWVKKQLKEEKYRTFLVDYIEWSNCLHWLLESWEKENE